VVLVLSVSFILLLCLVSYQSRFLLSLPVSLYILDTYVSHFLPYLHRGHIPFLQFSLYSPVSVSKFPIEVMLPQFSHSNAVDLHTLLLPLPFIRVKNNCILKMEALDATYVPVYCCLTHDSISCKII
jgi:hypothetical protein